MSSPAGDLKVAMKPRHLVMMSLGSAIGAGLFVGSGAGIATAGPAVLLSYVISGAIVLAVMRMLGEMVADDPNPGAFSYYADKALGPAAGFAIGWLWWIEMGLVVATEATAAARYLSTLIPGFPQWGFALIIMVVFTGINLVKVGSFGEFEFWFSLIKITFVVVFLVLGAAFLLGFTPAASPGWGNLLGSDFMPHGVKGVASALLVVIFAFGGVEIVAVAAAETADPERSIRKAVNTILWRILIFYMGAVTIMLLALPWNDPSLTDAPFVAVLNAAGLPAVAAMIGTVVVVALLSSLNANLYGGSRMIFSLAERRMGPAVMRGGAELLLGRGGTEIPAEHGRLDHDRHLAGDHRLPPGAAPPRRQRRQPLAQGLPGRAVLGDAGRSGRGGRARVHGARDRGAALQHLRPDGPASGGRWLARQTRGCPRPGERTSRRERNVRKIRGPWVDPAKRPWRPGLEDA